MYICAFMFTYNMCMYTYIYMIYLCLCIYIYMYICVYIYMYWLRAIYWKPLLVWEPAKDRAGPWPPGGVARAARLLCCPSGNIILGGSWDLVSRVISTLIGVISNYNYSYLTYNPSY